jgi:hypothetical protein
VSAGPWAPEMQVLGAPEAAGTASGGAVPISASSPDITQYALRHSNGPCRCTYKVRRHWEWGLIVRDLCVPMGLVRWPSWVANLNGPASRKDCLIGFFANGFRPDESVVFVLLM